MMATRRSILCPIDFSKHSRVALRHAAAIAREAGGRLTVLFVDDPLLVRAAASGYDVRVMAERSRLEMERFVARPVAAAGAGKVPLTVVTAVGTPDVEIVRTARRLRCDLIVMGTHGRRGVARLFLGSTTQGVLKRTSVPVLAIPPSRTAKVGGTPRRARR